MSHPIGCRVGSSIAADLAAPCPVLEEDDVITLYAFGTIFPEGRGETKDLWVQWALEELELRYEVHALDHTGGELERDAYSRISPFRQAPVIDDDGFVVAESAAIVLYLAEKAGKLLPTDVQGRIRTMQWCFAAVATVGSTLACLDIIGMFDSDRRAKELHAEVPKLAERWLRGVERRLEGHEWIACSDFTVADIMMASELRTVRKTDLLQPFPNLRAYDKRCHARPAWQRTLALTAERIGSSIDQIR